MNSLTLSGFSIGSVAPLAVAQAEQSDVLLHGIGLSDEGKRMVEIYKLMGDSHRLMIACLIHGESTNVTGMTDVMNESQPAVSHHLALFRKAGVLEDQRDGKCRFYEFARKGKQDMEKASRVLLGINPFKESQDAQPDIAQQQEPSFEISQLHSQAEKTPTGLEIVDTMRMLGDETRLSILLRLSGKEMTVTQVCDELEQSQPAVSHHLAKMRDEVKFLQKRRAGKNNFYSINPLEGVPLMRGAARVLQFFAQGPKKEGQVKPE